MSSDYYPSNEASNTNQGVNTPSDPLNSRDQVETPSGGNPRPARPGNRDQSPGNRRFNSERPGRRNRNTNNDGDSGIRPQRNPSRHTYNVENLSLLSCERTFLNARKIILDDVDPGDVFMDHIYFPAFIQKELECQAVLFARHLISSGIELRYILGNNSNEWQRKLEETYVYSYVKCLVFGLYHTSDKVFASNSLCFIGDYINYHMLRSRNYRVNGQLSGISIERRYGVQGDYNERGKMLTMLNNAYPVLMKMGCYINKTEVEFSIPTYEGYLSKMRNEEKIKCMIVEMNDLSIDYYKFASVEKSVVLGNSFYTPDFKRIGLLPDTNADLRSKSMILPKALFITRKSMNNYPKSSVNMYFEYELDTKRNVNCCYEVEAKTNLYVRGSVPYDHPSVKNCCIQFKDETKVSSEKRYMVDKEIEDPKY